MKQELTEEEFKTDVREILHNVFESSSEASVYYDEVIAWYYQSGEASAYACLKEITDAAYNRSQR